MDDTYQAEVVRLGENVEEEVELSIQGTRLVCFVAGRYPDGVQVGRSYPVALHLMVFWDYEVAEVEESTPRVIPGPGLSYELRGRLRGAVLDAGIAFRDDYLLSHYGYLDGKFVSMKVGRIDVEFLA